MSTKINPVNWFEIPLTDMSRAKMFYERAFDYELSLNNMDSMHMAWFPMMNEGVAATGSLVKAKSYEPSYSGSMVYFSVDNIEATLDKVRNSGGKVLNPKMSIGEYGFIAHFEDSEGNRIALHSEN